MRHEPTVRQTKRYAGAVLPLFAVLLCLPAVSALASSIDTKCNRGVRLVSSLDVPQLDLSIRDSLHLDSVNPANASLDNPHPDNVHKQLSTAIVDHVATNSIPSNDTDLHPQRAATSSKSSPRVNAILRQIFEKPTFDKSAFEQNETGPESATELADPALVIRNDAAKPDTMRDDETSTNFQRPAADIADAEPASASPEHGSDSGTGVNAHLPGISEDELSRYRREMYRTDI
ncbi:MAG TPA: hypothetical protein PKK10_03555 [Woeseiaceae bacterium]|nr:hypothetical protein [Woeseiaceae bacterium]